MTDNKTKLARILRTKSAKILACSMILVILVSSAVIPSFAAEGTYQTIAPISFNNFDRLTAVASFNLGDDVTLSSITGGIEGASQTYINNTYYYFNGQDALYTKEIDGVTVHYFTISVFCSYSAIYVNSVAYDARQATANTHATIMGAYEFICYPVENAALGGGYNTFYFDVVVENSSYIEEVRAEAFANGYQTGYSEGYTNGTGSQAVQNARDEGYRDGYAAGRESTDSENLGENLLGDTLSAPMDALNDFTLYESSSGFNVTLGLVVGGAICLTLLIAFLKIFAGG